MSLSGSENAEPRSSRQKLRKALEALTSASEAHGEGFSYEILDDLVHVQKRPTGTQRRHLAKKASKLKNGRPEGVASENGSQSTLAAWEA